METKQVHPAERKPNRITLPRLDRLFANAYHATLAKPLMREALLAVGLFCVLVLIFQIGWAPQRIELEVGEPAPQAVTAPREIEDLYTTKRLRDEAGAQARKQAEQDTANWYIARESGDLAQARLEQFIGDLQQNRELLTRTGTKPAVVQSLLAKLRADWEGVTTWALENLLEAPPDKFEYWQRSLAKLLMIIEENERISEHDFEAFRENISQVVRRAGGDADDRVLVGALRGLVAPNLVLDQSRLDELVRNAREGVGTVWYRAGQPIVDKGEVVSAEKMMLLKDLRLIEGSGFPVAFLSLVLFSLLLIAMAAGYLYRFRREVLRQERYLYLIAVTTIIAMVLGKAFTYYDLAYLAPVAFASILWILLLDSHVALMLTVLLSLFMGVVAGFQLDLTIYTLTGGSMAIFALSHRQQRSDIMTSGLLIAGMNIFSIVLLALLSGDFPALSELSISLALAASNGILAAVLAIGFLPFMENLFGMTSSIRLLELANPNQPLLRQLLVEAPGTYHHSIIVGNLAETAAGVVGADPLLVRVGAYYHDIGKIKRPYFFVENQIAQDNPHEKLSPTLSTLIITAHVKEGVEMARKAGLPESVVAILEQHHGTDLVRYFYARAAESSQSELAETDFRYDGPRPQSKEAALVMLADSVEAAARSMQKPTPAKFEAMVAKIIKERLADGQFDLCDLTLRDFEMIKGAFLKVLGGIFHTRIEYPENMLREFEKKRGNNGDSRKQSAESGGTAGQS